MSKQCPIHGERRNNRHIELSEAEGRRLLEIIEREGRREQEEEHDRRRVASMSPRERALACNDGVHSTILCSAGGCDRDPCGCACHETAAPIPPDPFRHLRRAAHSLMLCAMNRACQKCECKCHNVGTVRTTKKDPADGIPIPPDPFKHLRRR